MIFFFLEFHPLAIEVGAGLIGGYILFCIIFMLSVCACKRRQQRILGKKNTQSDHNTNSSNVRNDSTYTDLEIGQIRETGYRVYVASNYAARYNHGVRCYECLDRNLKGRKLRNMRGGHLLLYNWAIIILFIVSLESLFLLYKKLLIILPITTSIIYLLISCYNYYVHRINGNIIHDCMFEVDNCYLTGWSMNPFFKIPLHARIQQRELTAISDGRTITLFAQLQQRYHHLTDITIMLYSQYYKTGRGPFPKALAVHFVLFSMLFVLSIFTAIWASIFVC